MESVRGDRVVPRAVYEEQPDLAAKIGKRSMNGSVRWSAGVVLSGFSGCGCQATSREFEPTHEEVKWTQ